MEDEIKNPQLILIRRVLAAVYIPTVLIIFLRSFDVIEVDWTYLFGPVILSLYNLWLYINLALSSQAAESDKIDWKISPLFNVFAFVFSAFILFVFLKVDDLWDVGWGITLIPCWLCLGLYFMFLSIIVPALRAAGYNREVFFLILQGLAVLCTSIMFVNFKENESPEFVCIVLSPVYIVTFFQFQTFIRTRVQSKIMGVPKEFKNLEGLFLMSLFPALTFICLKYMVLDELPSILIYLFASKFLFSWILKQESYLRKAKKGYEQLN